MSAHRSCSCQSVCESACRDKEAIKPWSASFSSFWHISLSAGLFSTLSRRWRQQQEEADREGHLNKPSEELGSRDNQPSQIYDSPPSFPTQRPLSWAPGCIGLCLRFVTSVYLSFLFFSCPAFSFLCPSIFSLPMFLLLSMSFPISPLRFSQTSWATVHPDRVSTAVCALLSCSSRGKLHSLRHRPLSQHLCLLCSQHPRPDCDLDPKLHVF